MSITKSKSSNVGIRELARTLNLSIGTVSRSLNNRYGVNAETRAKVLEAANRLGYVPNTAARQLKAHPAFQIGLLFNPYYGPHGEVNPYATELIKALKQQAAAQGLGVTVIDYTDDNDLQQQFDTASTNVPVLLGEFPDSTRRKIHELDKPCISIQHKSDLPNQVSIVPDSRSAGETAVQYLAAMGHERIALMTGPRQSPHFHAIYQGYHSAMNEFHLPMDHDWVIELDRQQTNAEGSEEATASLLKRDRGVTAVIYASDWLAIGGIEAVRAAGLRVGQDVSVTGFDNLPRAAELTPPLTTFDLHWPAAVRAIIRLTFDLAAGKPPRDVTDNLLYLNANLVKRHTCACRRPKSD